MAVFTTSTVSPTNCEKDFCLSTPSSARLPMGCLGTYGYAYSPPFRSPLPRLPPPLGGGGDPIPGAVWVWGCYWGGSLGILPGRLPLRRRRLGWVPCAPGALPVVLTAPSIGGQCPDAGGATWAQGECLMGILWYFRTLHFLSQGFPQGAPHRPSGRTNLVSRVVCCCE